MTAKEIFRSVMDEGLEGDQLKKLMEDMAHLQREPCLGVRPKERKKVQEELRTLVHNAWNGRELSIEKLFRLCYAANSLQVPLPRKDKERNKRIAKCSFKRYQRGGYEDLDSYLGAIKLR